MTYLPLPLPNYVAWLRNVVAVGRQVSHTCGTQVVDLYNSTHIANTTDYYRNHEYNTYM